MSQNDRKPPDFSQSATKQAFKDQCDINKILKKAQKTGSLAFAQKYADFTFGEFDGEFSLLDAQQRIAKAGQIFAELPSEVRKEFANNPLDFVAFAADPTNQGRLVELLPELAEPGKYFPNPVQRGGVGAGAATAPAEAEPEAPPKSAGAPPPAESGTDGVSAPEPIK